jgi:hypothetical protein
MFAAYQYESSQGLSTRTCDASAETDLLRIKPDDKGRYVDHLLPYANMPLADKDTGVVDRLCETELVHLGLQAALHEVLDL